MKTQIVMKKIKLLYWFILALIMLYVIHFSSYTYLAFYVPSFRNFSKDLYENLIFGYYTQFVAVIFATITFIALFLLKNGLGITIKKGFFNQVSSRKFKIAGCLFLVSGVLSLLWDFILLVYSNSGFLQAPVSSSVSSTSIQAVGIGSDILLILIGFGLLIVSDFITNGNILKQENELTI